MIVYTVAVSSLTNSVLLYARNLKEASKMLISATVPGVAVAVARQDVADDIDVPFYFPKPLDTVPQPSIN